MIRWDLLEVKLDTISPGLLRLKTDQPYWNIWLRIRLDKICVVVKVSQRVENGIIWYIILVLQKIQI